MVFAIRADGQGTLYSVIPPTWLRPGAKGWTLCLQLGVAARIYHSLTRLVYVAPGQYVAND